MAQIVLRLRYGMSGMQRSVASRRSWGCRENSTWLMLMLMVCWLEISSRVWLIKTSASACSLVTVTKDLNIHQFLVYHWVQIILHTILLFALWAEVPALVPLRPKLLALVVAEWFINGICGSHISRLPGPPIDDGVPFTPDRNTLSPGAPPPGVVAPLPDGRWSIGESKIARMFSAVRGEFISRNVPHGPSKAEWVPPTLLVLVLLLGAKSNKEKLVKLLWWCSLGGLISRVSWQNS